MPPLGIFCTYIQNTVHGVKLSVACCNADAVDANSQRNKQSSVVFFSAVRPPASRIQYLLAAKPTLSSRLRACICFGGKPPVSGQTHARPCRAEPSEKVNRQRGRDSTKLGKLVSCLVSCKLCSVGFLTYIISMYHVDRGTRNPDQHIETSPTACCLRRLSVECYEYCVLCIRKTATPSRWAGSAGPRLVNTN